MPIKRYKTEQIVTILRQIEVELRMESSIPQACKEAEIRYRRSTAGGRNTAA